MGYIVHLKEAEVILVVKKLRKRRLRLDKNSPIGPGNRNENIRNHQVNERLM